MSATATSAPAPTTYFELLDRIDALARQTLVGVDQQRQFLQMLGGMPQNGTPAPVAAKPIPAPAPAPVASEDDARGVPDASKIIAAKKKPAKKPGRKPAPKTDAPAAEGAEGTESSEGEDTPGTPSLRSVCWAILTRPENMENGLKAGGGGTSVLQTILDEKSWVSKKNGNMAGMVSQCLHNLKKDGKITRNAETHCFIAKPGVTLD